MSCPSQSHRLKIPNIMLGEEYNAFSSPLCNFHSSPSKCKTESKVIGNLSFENVEKFKYLIVTVTNANDIREEIKRRIHMTNMCYYLTKILSSRLLSKKLKFNSYKTIILVLDGWETWSLVTREEHRLRVFANKVLRNIFGVKRDEITGEWRKLHKAELHAFYFSPNYD